MTQHYAVAVEKEASQARVIAKPLQLVAAFALGGAIIFGAGFFNTAAVCLTRRRPCRSWPRFTTRRMTHVIRKGFRVTDHVFQLRAWPCFFDKSFSTLC